MPHKLTPPPPHPPRDVAAEVHKLRAEVGKLTATMSGVLWRLRKVEAQLRGEVAA
jgi:hypothetical protein